jgi:hypothetical protein
MLVAITAIKVCFGAKSESVMDNKFPHFASFQKASFPNEIFSAEKGEHPSIFPHFHLFLRFWRSA